MIKGINSIPEGNLKCESYRRRCITKGFTPFLQGIY